MLLSYDIRKTKYYYILQPDVFFRLDPCLFEYLVTLVGKGSLTPATHITIINEDAYTFYAFNVNGIALTNDSDYQIIVLLFSINVFSSLCYD